MIQYFLLILFKITCDNAIYCPRNTKKSLTPNYLTTTYQLPTNSYPTPTTVGDDREMEGR